MSTNLIIALTIALAVIANTRTVVARSAPMLPSEMLESDSLANRMPYDGYPRYYDGWSYEKELEQAPPAAEIMRTFEKPSNLAEQFNNNLDEHMKTDEEERPELLPTPQPFRAQPYKKSNSQYHMTICHFKICNMGRKRSATWDADMGHKRDTLHQRF